MLLHIPELLSADELARAQQALADAPWQDGRHSAGSQAAAVKRNEQLPADSRAARALQELVLGALERSTLFFSAVLPKRVLPPQFNRYQGALNHYGRHVDQAVRYHPATRQALRSDLSCTVFLAAPETYEGGELVVEHPFGQQRVKLPAGDAVLYPGSSVHHVEPVTRGTRLAAFFWVESMVRSASQRRLLFDMDRALVRLRQRHGESDETISLTGSYHNLLREWADT